MAQKTAAISVERMAELAAAGANQTEIASIAKVSKQAVSRKLAKYHIAVTSLDTYKSNRADILAGIQDNLLKSVDQATIQKASLLQRVTAVGVLYDKERLERGQSTQNISTQSTIAVLQSRARDDSIPPSAIDKPDKAD